MLDIRVVEPHLFQSSNNNKCGIISYIPDIKYRYEKKKKKRRRLLLWTSRYFSALIVNVLNHNGDDDDDDDGMMTGVAFVSNKACNEA